MGLGDDSKPVCCLHGMFPEQIFRVPDGEEPSEPCSALPAAGCVSLGRFYLCEHPLLLNQLTAQSNTALQVRGHILPHHPAHPKQAQDRHQLPIFQYQHDNRLLAALMRSESQTKMGIKPRTSLLYQWFSTQSITKGILKVKGGLAKPSLSNP